MSKLCEHYPYCEDAHAENQKCTDPTAPCAMRACLSYGNLRAQAIKASRRQRLLAKCKKFLKHFTIFQTAGLIGFLIGSAAYALLYTAGANPVILWIVPNGVGGITHYAVNYSLQRLH